MFQINFLLFLFKIGLASLISFFHYFIGIFAILLEIFSLYLYLSQFFINFSPLRNWIRILGPIWNSQVIFFVRVLLNYLRLVFNEHILTAKTGISHSRRVAFEFSKSLRIIQICRSFKLKISRYLLDRVALRKYRLCRFFSLCNGS